MALIDPPDLAETVVAGFDAGGIYLRHAGKSEALDVSGGSIAESTMDSIQLLLVEHGLPGLDKQLYLADLVGDPAWQLDQDAGTITFDGHLVCQAQVLGTQMDQEATWRWAWANPSVPDKVAVDSKIVRSYGSVRGIGELNEPELPLGGSVSGEALALIATSLTEADAYYRGDLDNGAVFVLLRLPPDVPKPVRGDGLRAVRTLSAAPMSLGIPLTRSTVENYLRWVGLQIEDRGPDLIGRGDADRSVTIKFDALGRIKEIASTFRP